MLAAVFEDIKKMEIKEVPKPEPDENSAVVRVRACGICQTDYKAYTGERRNWTAPMIAGHEMAGIIAEIKNKSSGFSEGDEVIISPVVSCGICEYCRSGYQHYCLNGAVIGGDGFETVWDGGFAEYVKVPISSIYKKPKNIPFSSAALTEPLAGSYKGLIEYTNMRLGEDIVILGSGGMGLLLTQLAKATGAGNLIVTDIDDYKLEYAKKCGADYTINAIDENVRERIYEIIEKGPDIVFEAAGTLEAAEQAVELCRRGTRVNMFGVTTPGTIPISPGKFHFSEIKMDASFSVSSRAMLKSVMLMEKGLVNPELIITHRFPLKKIDDAFDTMAESRRIKIIIEP